MKRTLIALAAATAIGAAGLAATQTFAHGPGGNAGPGWGYGMMGSGYGPGSDHMGYGPGMMRGGYGPGMMGTAYGPQGTPCPAWGDADDHEPLTLDDARKQVEQRLAWMGNPHLKVGTVEAKNDKTYVATIVTADGSLVDTLEIDRATGFMRPVR